MTPHEPAHIGRLYDLLARQQTDPLLPAEEAELQDLLAKWPHVDAEAVDRTAALVQAASADPLPDLPPDLFDRLEADATAHLNPARPSELARPRRRWPSAFQWCVAAALVVVVGVEGWRVWERQQNLPQVALSQAQERERLLTAGAKRYAAKSGDGDVIWDTPTQRGYLSVSGLPANDPTRKQYQLWIVDAGRAHKEPVDGGVFDVGADGRAVVAIKPALALRNPVLFAVTEEPPGGVVVSERGKEGKFEAVFSE